MVKVEIDPQRLLEQLKAEHRVLRWEPLAPDSPKKASDGAYVGNRSSMEYLHAHWALPDAFDPSDAGSGPKGRVLELLGRLTYRVLGRYLREERELLGHMVRVNQSLERRCDELALRCQELSQAMIDRQVAEAANQVKLALWLNLDPPDVAASDAPTRPPDTVAPSIA